jgi:hypothetical protein
MPLVVWSGPESAARRSDAVDRRLGCTRGYDGWGEFLAQRPAGNRQDGDEEPDRQGVYAPERAGEYEAVYRLPILSAIAAPDVPEMADLHAFGTWLVETRNALREGPSGQPVPGTAVDISAVDEAWLRVAVEKVEQAVDLLVDDFAEHPYRHRVEHSLHLQLYRALADHRQFDVLAPVGTSSLRAGLVHKEWPETLPGRDADRRGLFDLAVLAPSQLAQASIDQFRQGRIHARIVVEVGLDYGRAHLEQDLEKLRNSGVPYAYVVHFSRLPAAGNVEDLLTSAYPNIRTAYAHLPPAGGSAVKHLTDTDIIRSG